MAVGVGVGFGFLAAMAGPGAPGTWASARAMIRNAIALARTRIDLDISGSSNTRSADAAAGMAPVSCLHFGCHGQALGGRLEIQAQNPLALRVERAGRDEAEALVEAAGEPSPMPWLVRSSVAPSAR